ncbi:hypothetical protein HanIR_Chr17g0891121 [Helianthus annuus]|nr:hypothetical protein HanIR_Chr17g0891121 [Helianthus annuus]
MYVYEVGFNQSVKLYEITLVCELDSSYRRCFMLEIDWIEGLRRNPLVVVKMMIKMIIYVQ